MQISWGAFWVFRGNNPDRTFDTVFPPSTYWPEKISKPCPLLSNPHHIARGHVTHELFKIRRITREINIQPCSIMYRQLSFLLSVSLLSVIRVTICIPVALGWSELVPIEATCQACRVRQDWAALFFLTPTLVCWQVIFPLRPTTTYCLSLPKESPQKAHLFLFFPLPLSCMHIKTVFWFFFYSRPNRFGYLHCTLWAIERLKKDTLAAASTVHWLNKLCIKKHPRELAIMQREQRVLWISNRMAPPSAKDSCRSLPDVNADHQKNFSWSNAPKLSLFPSSLHPQQPTNQNIYFCNFWLCQFIHTNQLSLEYMEWIFYVHYNSC